MSVEDDLLTIERQFWTGDAEFYRRNLDDACLVAFTEMAGVKSKDDIAGMIADDKERWRDLKIAKKGFMDLPGMAMLSYEAQARKGSGPLYKALVTSGYVKRGEAWKMAFHQQTPLPA